MVFSIRKALVIYVKPKVILFLEPVGKLDLKKFKIHIALHIPSAITFICLLINV
jgi:hypothetical protein